MLWVRAEERPSEHRTPIVPADAAKLVGHGLHVVVEDAPQRIYPATAYAAAGCEIVPSGQWRYAPRDAYVVGLKELPDDGTPLIHSHVYFGHCYKGQPGADALLRRFTAGGGELLDLEYLIDAGGRRLAAFGYWAGYAGAALGVLQAHGLLASPLVPMSKQGIDAHLAQVGTHSEAQIVTQIRTLVIGALGRCGTGARDALAQAGQVVTAWDLAETRDLDRSVVIGHDLLVNAVLTTGPAPPFVTAADVRDRRRRLATIADVTCDVGSPHHTIPIYDATTTWKEPVRRVAGEPAPLDVIAIDNLPSLLPREASDAFSADLAPHLRMLDGPDPGAGRSDVPWAACRQRFRQAASQAPSQTRTEPVSHATKAGNEPTR